MNGYSSMATVNDQCIEKNESVFDQHSINHFLHDTLVAMIKHGDVEYKCFCNKIESHVHDTGLPY